MGNDIRYMPEKLEQASNFANKIWNAAKFILNNLASKEEILSFGESIYEKETGKYQSEKLKIEDRWILNRLDHLIQTVTKNIEEYDLGIALDNIYSFIWNEFCDWYIEMVKTRLYSSNQQEKIQVSFVLNEVFRDSLKLLHPFMPFVTSEIYEKLVNRDDKELMMTHWPEIRQRVDYDEKENVIEKIKEIIVSIRNVRTNRNIHPSKKAQLIFVTTKYQKEIEESKDFILKLGFGKELKIQKDKTQIPEDAIQIISDEMELYMPLEGLIDQEEERKRIEEERKRLEQEIARCEKMLSNPGFMNKAPKAKIEEETEKLKKYQDRLNKLS